MRPPKHPEPLPERPSKTQQKASMHALQDVGSALVELSPAQLKRIALPDDLREAVAACQKITAHGARRRQLQYIGKLMRGHDPAPIEAELRRLAGDSAEETARLHRLERLRQRFLEDETVLTEIVAQWPHADLTHLRQLRRNALKEAEAGKPPRSFRLIFQTLKALQEEVHAS